MMRSDFPAGLLNELGNRIPRPLKNIIIKYPEFWKLVLANTDSDLTDKERYDLFWDGLFTYKDCFYDSCSNKVVKNHKGEFCSTRCMYDSGIVQSRVKETCLERYGSASSLGGKEIREKIKKTCLEKYGVENAGWSKESQERIKETCKARYGSDSPSGADEIRRKMKATINERYGSDSPFSSVDIKNKIKATLMERYGVDNIFRIDEYRNTEKNKATKSSKFNLEILDDKNLIKETIKKHGWKGVADMIGFRNTSHTSTYRILRYNEFDFLKRSRPELEIKAFIESLGLEVIHNSRSIIKPYELDIFIPEKNIAIEYDGLFWHSSRELDNDKKCSTNHLNKTLLCEEKGIHLIHLFENEWVFKTDTCKSMIKYKLGESDVKICSTKCIVKYIDDKVAYDFCEDNHLEGGVNCSFSIGLFYESELVMVSSYAKSTQDELELVRSCGKLNNSIIGGSSKIFKFLNKQFTAVVDRRWSNRDDYAQYGAKLLSTSDPDYWYTLRDKLFHKSYLAKDGILDDDLSHVQNCYDDGYGRIWDCGYYVFDIEP